MAAGFGERQRAEEFARLLDSLDAASRTGVATLDRPDGTGDGERPGVDAGAPDGAAPRVRIPRQVDPEMATLLRAVDALVEEGRRTPLMRPEFKAELGQRLQADFLRLFDADVDKSDHGDGDPAGRHRPGWKRRLGVGGLALGVLSGGVGGVAWAASGALPGDPLYGVKRSLENMRVSVSGSDLEKGEQYLGQAKTRLGEIHRLLAHHDANVDGSEVAGHISTAMDSLDADVDTAGTLLTGLAEKGDADALAHLQDFLTTYEPQVHDLETLLAPGTQPKAAHLLALMQSFQVRLTAAQAAIDRARTAGQPRPAGATSHRGDAAPSTAASSPVGDQKTGAVPGSGPAGSTAAPAGGSSTPLNLSVPLGSSAATVVVPPLLSGLPPIGITLGGSPAPTAQGPTGPTADAGPPPTDPNPN